MLPAKFTDTTKRVLRTAYHGLASALVLLPMLQTFLKGTPAAAQLGAFVAVLTAVSKVLNTLEDKGLLPAFLRDVNTGTPDLTASAAADASVTPPPAPPVPPAPAPAVEENQAVDESQDPTVPQDAPAIVAPTPIQVPTPLAPAAETPALSVPPVMATATAEVAVASPPAPAA